MKIKKVVNHGTVRWRVKNPRGMGGERQGKFLETKEAAERFTRQKNTDSQAYGIHFAATPPSERASLGYQLERLCRANASTISHRKRLGWP